MRLGANVHGNADYDEVRMMEKLTLEDEGVKAAIAELQLPEGAVVCADPWIYGLSPTPPPASPSHSPVLQVPMA